MKNFPTLKTLPALLLACMLAQTGVWADPVDEPSGAGTLVSRTEHRTITTTETRKPNPDGSVAGTFTQIIKGNGSPEKLTVKGVMTKVDDKETFTLDETGRTADGMDVSNEVSIVRDLVGGVLIEKLSRKSKKKNQNPDAKTDLGGLPAFVITQENQDGSKVVKVFNDPKADITRDLPSLTFDIPIDGPTSLGQPPLEIFIANVPPVLTTPPAVNNPNGGTPPNVGTDPDITLATPPQLPPALPPVTPPVVLPDPPKKEETPILLEVNLQNLKG